MHARGFRCDVDLAVDVVCDVRLRRPAGNAGHEWLPVESGRGPQTVIRRRVLSQYPQPRIVRRMSPITVALKRAREAAQLTQLQLADIAGVRQATISELETGKTRRVDLEVLDRLCVALDVEPGELLERDAKKRGRR